MIKETTIENYQEQALRTMASLGTKAMDGMHMAAGFTTEIGEMNEGIAYNDIVNIREEHGDTYFYIANECSTYGLIFTDLIEQAKTRRKKPFYLHNIVDLHKREFAYGKEMDLIKLEDELITMIQYLSKVEKDFKFTIEESLVINIKKLYKRYPDKFTEEKALNRDLEAEYKTLK